MIFGAPFADVMKQGRDKKCTPVLDRLDDRGREWQLGRHISFLDLDEIANRAQQMFVHREVVVHIELHHGDHAAEIRDEASEHASLIHPPQDTFRICGLCQQLKEDAVGFNIVPELVIDQAQRVA